MSKRLKSWGLGTLSSDTSAQTPPADNPAPAAPDPGPTNQISQPQMPNQMAGPFSSGQMPANQNIIGQVQQQMPSQAHMPATASSNARSFRLSTLISEEHGDLLEDMRHIIRKQTGRRPKIAEIVEAALEALENEMTGGGSS